MDWNIQPIDKRSGRVPIIFDWIYKQKTGEEDEYELKPEFWTEENSDNSAPYDSDVEKIDKVTFKEPDRLSIGHKSLKSLNESVLSDQLFQAGKDDIIMEGELMKFKPGITVNFIPRYVQISQRAFRYFKNRYEAKAGKPIVAFRKRIIKAAQGLTVNKGSYLKPGSRIAQSHKEDHLFDNMFEILLNEDYEDNYNYRDVERANKDFSDRREFEDQMGVKKVTKKNGEVIYRSSSPNKSNNSPDRSRSAVRLHESVPAGSTRNHEMNRKMKISTSYKNLTPKPD